MVRTIAAAAAVLVGGAALVVTTAGDALAARPASVIEGRGRIVVALPDSDDVPVTEVEVWIDGRNVSCDGHPCKVAQRHAYSLAYNLPGGSHRVEVRQPGGADLLDRVVDVPAPDRLLDDLQCRHLPVPQDHTLVC
ncbi:hypothetical protein [Nocardia arthritidis]|uniref:hypothetical protein n=1 Tax=Nocardia arthritidis TaxID=228602 RepID=UPI0007A45302|nr:hypothetical protein [Nocardia arthritidis]